MESISLASIQLQSNPNLEKARRTTKQKLMNWKIFKGIMLKEIREAVPDIFVKVWFSIHFVISGLMAPMA